MTSKRTPVPEPEMLDFGGNRMPLESQSVMVGHTVGADVALTRVHQSAKASKTLDRAKRVGWIHDTAQHKLQFISQCFLGTKCATQPEVTVTTVTST